MFDPDQQCPQIEFAPEDRAQYGHAALRLLQNTMAERTKFNADPQDWAFIKHRKEFSIFRSVRGSANQSTVVMVGTGLIDGRIEDILEGLYCGTTHELRNARVLLGYDVKGISVPNSHERLTQDDPFLFASTKSLVGKCALKLVYERDALTYERVGTTTDARGQELTYHTVQPIKRPEWPSERQDIASCYLSRQDKFTNKTEVFLWGSILRFGSDPEEAIQLGVASTWLNVVRSPDVGHAKKYSALMDEADSHQRMPSRYSTQRYSPISSGCCDLNSRLTLGSLPVFLQHKLPRLLSQQAEARLARTLLRLSSGASAVASVNKLIVMVVI